jgi:hypothetical protein
MLSDVNRAQRVAVFVGLLIVLSGVAWALVPFAARGRSCSAGIVEAVRDRRVTVTVPISDTARGVITGETRRVRAESPCATGGTRRSVTGGIMAAAGVVAAIAGVVILRDPTRRHRRGTETSTA